MAVLWAIAPADVLACGPFFPNTVLNRKDASLLAAPVGSVEAEMRRLAPTTWPAVNVVRQEGDGDGLAGLCRRTSEVDLADLDKALTAGGLEQPRRGKILADYKQTRQEIVTFLERVEKCLNDPSEIPPVLEAKPPAGLPAEFEHYIRGAILYHQGENQKARQEWQAVLDLPPEQRKFRTTWAAYMVARSYVETDPEEAVKLFAAMRELPGKGFPDPLGLAAESLGWEARAELNRGNWSAAVKLYLQQLSAGDARAAYSLRDVAARAFAGGEETLKKLAGDPTVRPVLAAYVVARGGRFGQAPDDKLSAAWLAAVESAGAKDVPEADRLAWAAYQLGDFQAARRWVDRAGSSGLAEWIRAKLLLRDGNCDAAAERLSKAVQSLPKVQETNCLWYYAQEGSPLCDPASAAGELAFLKMARSQYVEALDLLIRHGWWTDAAYVAERVLSTKELAAYVDKNWPAPASTGVVTGTTRDIRALTGRRLVREGRCAKAMPYFDDYEQKALGKYVAALLEARDDKLPSERRASAFLDAARTVRRDGMSIMGTELEPDFHVHGGNFEEGRIAEFRMRTTEMNFAPPSLDERFRAGSAAPSPDKRFHYRYVAAELAWQAALLMPNESEETARVLCEAGGWLKARDPEAADRFYKAILFRCGQTDIGRKARQLHWFPKLEDKKE